jgi:hypothetical protein
LQLELDADERVQVHATGEDIAPKCAGLSVVDLKYAT